MPDDRPVIAVIGATGAQGGAVVRALLDHGSFRVRALASGAALLMAPAGQEA